MSAVFMICGAAWLFFAVVLLVAAIASIACYLVEPDKDYWKAILVCVIGMVFCAFLSFVSFDRAGTFRAGSGTNLNTINKEEKWG